jgi:hypothetical protein
MPEHIRARGPGAIWETREQAQAWADDVGAAHSADGDNGERDDDLIFVPADQEWTTEVPTARLRWHGDTLQQAWAIQRSVNYQIDSITEEWRDVPRVADAATQTHEPWCDWQMDRCTCAMGPPSVTSEQP